MSKLCREHLVMLSESGITPEYAALRSYETIENSSFLKAEGFGKAVQNLGSGLLVPLLRADGAVAGYQFRPDNPRLRNGKEIKYETPTGQPNIIDIPPGVGDLLDDPNIELWITEGTKKADCGAIRGLCIVALSGVWNWIGKNKAGGKTALPDWRDIALNGRRVILAYDSDATQKPDVLKALTDFAAWLETKDARVEYLHLPDNGDEKVGLDDYLVHREVSELFGLVKNHPPQSDGGRRNIAEEYRFKDAYIGQEIAETYFQGKFIYSGSFGWMRFDGKRWASTNESVVYEVVRKAVIEMLEKASEENRGVHVLKPLSGLLSANRIGAILRIAKGYVATEAERFDAHPHLLNVNNGVVDMRTGNVAAHDPKLMLTKVTMVDYVKDATHTDWDQALTAVPNDVRRWLQTRLGQAITGSPVPDDKMVILKGSGENGKTTVVDAVRFALGNDYAVTLPDRVLLSRTGDHPTEMMVLRGARLAFMEEFPELGHLNVKRLKDLHGVGEISARYCGKDTVFWEPTHTIFVTTNYLPRVDESDHGTWRRLVLAPFPYKYVKKGAQTDDENIREGDPDLRSRLRASTDGQHEAILSWLVSGAMQWYKNGQIMPEEPKSVVAATKNWRLSADILLRFFQDQMVFDAGAHVMSNELFAVFAHWLKTNGHVAWTDRNFSERLTNHSEISLRGVEKKVVRSSRGNLSRPSSAISCGPVVANVPGQYNAWIGARFRRGDERLKTGPDLQLVESVMARDG